jgi:hypothetical protein
MVVYRGKVLAAALLVVGMLALPCAAAGPLKFWNTTSVTIVTLKLAPAGSGNWGPNQCLNDPDKSVDADERLKITGIEPGRYDVQLTDKAGRSCRIDNVEVKSSGPYAFSISDKDLTHCTK